MWDCFIGEAEGVPTTCVRDISPLLVSETFGIIESHSSPSTSGAAGRAGGTLQFSWNAPQCFSGFEYA